MTEHSLPAPAETAPGARLGRSDWIAAATALLASEGIDAVRVERLAKQLKVTKGSFYWHFKDRGELHAAMLEAWRAANTFDIDRTVRETPDPTAVLRAAMRLPFSAELSAPTLRIALSLRLWARVDPAVAAVLKHIDDLRVELYARLFAVCGFTDARERGVLLYAYMRVALELIDRDDAGLQARCEELLLGRRA